MPRIPSKDIRNHAIIEALKRGESRGTVGRRFGISAARVSEIYRHGGVLKFRRERRAIPHPDSKNLANWVSEWAGFWLANQAPTEKRRALAAKYRYQKQKAVS